VIQIVVHQFEHKTSAKKNPSEKKWPYLIPRYAGIRRISAKEKKMISNKPHVHGEHVKSILGTILHEKKIDLNNTIPNNVHLVDPFIYNMNL
jgi:hypothetical protein